MDRKKNITAAVPGRKGCLTQPAKDHPRPLPILLGNILPASGMNGSAEAVRAASVFLSAIAMIIAYTFIRKYFTGGTLPGSVKG